MRRREEGVGWLPFGGVEAEAEEGERELDEALGACCGCARDGHGGVVLQRERESERKRKMETFFGVYAGRKCNGLLK